MNEEMLFGAALEKATPAERQEFLDEACAGDEELRRRVERLLAADEEGGVLDTASNDPPRETSSPVEAPGAVIGPYKLREQIGEGGFGLVYVAEQQQPVRRKVALKIVKPGLETREVIARFEAERQALALMDHPNIARVFDAGVSDSGRPYFVMELVRGLPINEYCDQHQFTTGERLELFISVCQAIQHAHQKGIIHRDLKPSNLLVERHDDRSVVKVIDFGVAKALKGQISEHSVYTRFAQIVGTPLYMSPEQAEMSGQDVDTRSDIYSLGVLLYELLTGTTPFDKERLRTVGFDELRRIIREEDPPKPSTRISTLGQAATTVSANRRSDPRRLGRSIRGELDWIAMKALEKDRARRYETAADLARDVQRYLRDEPVEASPPSRLYCLRKFLRRNRGPALAATLISLALVGGIVGTTWGMIRAEGARDAEAQRAESEARERLRAEGAEAEAKRNEREARSTTHLANEMVMFLKRDLLGTAVGSREPFEKYPPNPNLTVREALDRAAASVGERFKGQRHVEAGIRMTIGEAYRRLGEHEKAINELRRTAELRRQYRGADHLETLEALHKLAQAVNDAGRAAEAIKLYEQVRDGQIKQLGPEHDQTLTTLTSLAIAYRDDRRTPEALALFKHVLDIRTRTLDPDDPRTLSTRHNIATMAMDAGDLAEAIAQFKQILDARERVNGREHPNNLPTLNNLAVAYWKTKQLDKSIPVFERLVLINQKYWGETHLDTISSMANLGVNYRDAGRLDEALPRLKGAYEKARTHPRLHWIGGELLIAYARAGKAEEVKTLAGEFVASARKVSPIASPQLADALARSGYALVNVEAWAEAESLLRECLAIRQNKAADDWRTFNTQSMLGQALLGLGKFADAEPLLLVGYQGMKQRAVKVPADRRVLISEALKHLAELYENWGKPAEAARWRMELDFNERPRNP